LRTAATKRCSTARSRQAKRPPRWRQRLFVAAAAAALASTAAASQMASAAPAPSGQSGSMALPVARQDYVTDTPTNPASGEPIDPYNGDPTSIHVAVSSGKELARSFVWIPLSYLPQGTEATDVTAKFVVTNQSEASSTGNYSVYNVNTSTAIIEACVLTTELPSNFDPNNPPAYDCADGSAIGKPDSTYSAWSFDLRDLVGYWDAHGDTGAALVPISPSLGATFSVSFYTSLSQASATYAPTPYAAAQSTPASPTTPAPLAPAGAGAAPASTASAPAPSASTANPSAGAPFAPGAAASTGSPGTFSAASLQRGSAIQSQNLAPTASGNAAPSGSPEATRGAPAGGGGSPTWPWVLAGCLTLAAAALVFAHRQRIAALGRRVFPPAANAFRAHPRAHTVAAMAAVWGLVFTGYSLSNAGTPATNGFVASNGAPAAGGSAAPGAAGSTGAPVVSSQGGSVAGVAATGATTAAGGVDTAAASGSSGSGGGSSRTGSPGTGASPSGGSGSSGEFSGPGTWQTIDGIPVFFPANGGPPVADLYHGADDTIGITPNSIKICTHAALTYGSAFNISANDLNVYWDWLNAHGGIFGRQIVTSYQNDNYDPGQAVQAAQACKDWGTFLLIGGIGFDQVPAVRQWAEQNQELYLYTTATSQDTQGLRYSFTAMPSVEQMGAAMGEVAVHQFAGKKVGIIYRNSSNWTPGVSTFEQVVKAAGMQIVGSYPVTINQGNYISEITQLRSAGAQVVFAWENALADVEIIKQAQGQSYYPGWLVAGFNIETNTLGASSLDQPIWSAQPFDTYDPGYYGGGFAPIAPEIHEFEAQYKQYDPNADLSGDGGDILFQTWEGWVELAHMLQMCGPNCTRNRLAGLWLAGYDQTVPPNCNVDFGATSDHHEGGSLFQVLHVIKDPNGRPNFVPVQRCVSINQIQ
jgi:hypothetical protein